MPSDTAEDAIRLLVAEDHPMVAVALDSAFELVDDIQVVERTGSVADTITATARARPNVVLLDRRLRDGDGIEAITTLCDVSPGVRVLVFTGYADRDMLDRVARAGGAGLMLKTGLFEDLLQVIRRVAAGDDYFDADLGH
ncbi:DNA-binding NarL/FixJ family response regulator [Nocardia transvalensis]|uniref:DNA-binding NarL/FixJ family response regulator n=1 Tax=Nocardia transvalensis TaxID=37333 RepID=A0A7W9UKC4_9NOCA|nr:response regulator transcription factor [Nocardia transvalensis]MBB5916291.1 DNA-binding NarL/FixJ family response regulator [Nocardia transvalensis]